MKDLDLSILGLSEDCESFDIEDLELIVPEPQPIAPPKNSVSAPITVPDTIRNLEDIRDIWLASRSPAEVAVQAQSMPFGVWMDYAIKLAPKQVNVKGQIDMRAAFVNLGPPQKR